MAYFNENVWPLPVNEMSCTIWLTGESLSAGQKNLHIKAKCGPTANKQNNVCISCFKSLHGKKFIQNWSLNSTPFYDNNYYSCI